MRRALLWLGCAAATAVGCGSSVVDPGQAGTTTGSGGATAGSGGAGGDVSVTTGTGGGPLCADGTVFVDIAGDVPMQHIDASCAPEGFLVFDSAGAHAKTPHGPTPSGIMIRACTTGPDVVLVLFGHGPMWPGTSMVVSVGFQHDEYEEIPAQTGLLEVDTVEPLGGVIEGSFSATVAPEMGSGMPQLAIHGTFRVCHTDDQYPA